MQMMELTVKALNSIVDATVEHEMINQHHHWAFLPLYEKKKTLYLE